jgi:hypothetical protein
MDRRRAVAYARVGIAYPVATVALAAGSASLLGWDAGLVVLALSMVAAATLAGVLLDETGGMRPADAERGREQQRGVLGLGGGSGDAPTSDIARGRRGRLRVYAAGLFLLTVALVLLLGGVVPGA